ncbi:unnamed protein product [Cuscuta europaea]|uniref:Uncharacterized protein n=1 Tax=Cuscuta europaea TaxID=41803 RepID=A0A9P0ZII9_CUSEU|nr:unnamed protein product [Cuscuta europaea]
METPRLLASANDVNGGDPLAPSPSNFTRVCNLSAAATASASVLLLLSIAIMISSLKGPRDDEAVIPIIGAVGPESFAFDSNGDGPYTGVSDGRIIKWQRNQSRWIDFAVTSPERGQFPVEETGGKNNKNKCGWSMEL